MIKVYWGNAEETLLIWRFGASWALKDFYKALRRSKRKVQQKQESINLIVDLRASRTWPSMMLLLAHAVASFSSNDESRTIIVSPNPIYKQLWKTSQRLYGAVECSIYFVATVDEAYWLICDNV